MVHVDSTDIYVLLFCSKCFTTAYSDYYASIKRWEITECLDLSNKEVESRKQKHLPCKGSEWTEDQINVLKNRAKFNLGKMEYNFMSLVEKSLKIAEEAHQGQVRKWSRKNPPDPYIVHPKRCAAMAKELGLNEKIQAAMLAHDVIEDCGEQWAEKILAECGQDVLSLVRELTFPTEGKEWEGRPRAEKNVIREAQMRKMTDDAKKCKMLDSIDNYRDMEAAPRRLIQKTVDDGWRRLDILKYADENLAKIMKDALQELQKKC